MATIKALTVDQLLAHLVQAHKAGLGGKHILLSNDDEGNGYHEMFYAMTPPDKDMFCFGGELPFGLSVEEVLKNYIILG